MKMKKPKEETYFYECTAKRKRIYYHIPIDKLKVLVNKGKAHKNILRDFPYGIDIKVTKDAFDEVLNKYKLALKVIPEEIWNAFLSLWLKNKRSFRGSNYINKSFLENLSIKIKNKIDRNGQLKCAVPRKLESVKERENAFIAQMVQYEKKLKFLNNYEIPELKKEKPITKQFFSEVEMTKGEEPFMIFNAVQMHKKKEK